MKQNQLNNIQTIIFESKDIFSIKKALKCVKLEKQKNDEFSYYYMSLCYLESVARNRIVMFGHLTIEETRDQLIKSFTCAMIAELCCKKLGYGNTSLEKLSILHQKGVILYDLYKFNDNPLKDLKNAINIFKYIRENVDENSELYKLSTINECNCLVELARIEQDSKENCLKAIKFIEESKKYFNQHDEKYKLLFLNLTNALSIFIKYEPYGLGVEFYETMKLLFKKYDKKGLLQFYLDLKLIELGYKSFNELDENLEEVKEMKDKLQFDQEEYHDCVLLEGDILFKRSYYENNFIEKIGYLNQCIEIYTHYRNINSFDTYYSKKTLLKEAIVRFELSKLNISRENNINTAKSLLLDVKEYYETVPFQNNNLNYPLVLMYLAKIEKERNLINNTLNENHQIIKDYLIKSISYFKINNNEERIIECYMELGDLFYLTNNYNEALTYLKKGVELVELIRNSIMNFNLKNLFLKKTSKLYELTILTYHKLGKNEETLKYVELSKHRGFIDKISERQQNYFVKDVDKNLFFEIKDIEKKILETLNEIKKIDENNFNFYSNYTKLSELRMKQRKKLIRLKKEFQKFYDYHYNHYFDYKTLKIKDKTLIEYYYTNNILLIFLIEDEKLIIKSRYLKNDILTKNIREFNEKLDESLLIDNITPTFLSKIDTIMEKLFDLIMKPIKNEITQNRLVIMPYGELYNIPFYCLKNKGQYLIDYYTITIAQSGLSIKYLKNNHQYQNLKNALVIGIQDEKLSCTKQEAKIVSKELNTQPLFNEDATKRNVLKLIEEKQIIHYAGHGFFNLQNPSLSYLKLIDGKLFVKDIENMNINSELITLSACETGIIPYDDEINAFINTLQIDGVKYIIASLWNVFDESTKDLFEYFYKRNEDYPERLRLAQLYLKEKYDILHWGAFQIYGL